jgi:aminoglycoside phosphotransferase
MRITRALDSAFGGQGPWVLEETLQGGSQSAHLVRDSAGVTWVAKLHTDSPMAHFAAVKERVARLRARGVPAPGMAAAAVGTDVLLLLDLLPGVPDPPLTRELVEELLALNAVHEGAGDGDAVAWRELMAATLTQGLQGYCEHGSLAAFSDESRRLLDRVTTLGTQVDFDRLPADDLVHYDFHPANFLSVDGRHVSGIVDWDAVMDGDRLLDVAMLAFTASWRADVDVMDHLWSSFFALGDERRRSVAMHHAVLRLVDWLIRHGTPDQAQLTVRAGWVALENLDAGRMVRTLR